MTIAASVLVSVFCEAGLDSQVFVAAVTEIIDSAVAELLGYCCGMVGTAACAAIEEYGGVTGGDLMREPAGEFGEGDV